LRVTRVALHLASGVAIAALVFPWLDATRRVDCIRRWSAKLLHILKIRFEVEGVPPAASVPLLLVANHVSWLDPFLINAIRPVRFIAKSEVAHWPVIGWLAARAGTLFVIRNRRHHTAQINQRVIAAMQEGAVFAVFPEGTTTDGSMVLPFHASLLQPAFESRALLVPLALRYLRVDGSLCTEVAYDGDKSVLDTLRAMSKLPSIRAQVKFLTPLACTDYPHRRELAHAAEQTIASALRLAALNTRTETAADPQAAVR
jgi:1-acyl-sn-glycerol-3-phosphate acyltransferase